MTKRKMSISELVEQLRSEQLLKKDMVVPASCLKMLDGNMTLLNIVNNDALQNLLIETGISTSHVDDDSVRKVTLEVLGICHNQIASKLNIPLGYYDKLLNEGHLKCLDENVNYWLEQSKANYFVRTFVNAADGTGVMRAMLSDRFKVIDNYDVLIAALDAIKQSGVEVNITNCDLTDKKMYVRVEAPHVVVNSPALLKNYRVPSTGDNGDTGIVAGFILSNSETGNGLHNIAPRLVVRACENGMIVKEDAHKKTHLGGKMEEFSQIEWSEETQIKNMELIVSQTKDAVKTFLSQEYLGACVGKLEEKGTKQLEHPLDAVKNVAKEFSFSEERQKNVLDFFIKGGDTTAFGITQAITFQAHKNENADEQYEMEKLAVTVVENAEKFDKPYSDGRKKGMKGFRAN